MTKKKLVLQFHSNTADQPLVYHLVRDYNLIINIFRARLDGTESGHMVMDLSGEEEALKKGIAYLRESGITVEESGKGVLRNDELCTSCGACLSHCPTKALNIKDDGSMAVTFSPEKCIECLNCLSVCPFNAMSSFF